LTSLRSTSSWRVILPPGREEDEAVTVVVAVAAATGAAFFWFSTERAGNSVGLRAVEGGEITEVGRAEEVHAGSGEDTFFSSSTAATTREGAAVSALFSPTLGLRLEEVGGAERLMGGEGGGEDLTLGSIISGIIRQRYPLWMRTRG